MISKRQRRGVSLFGILLPQCAEACIDSNGNFYCATLWYFWFVLFWIFIILFVIIVCIVNRCNKKKVRVDYHFPEQAGNQTGRNAQPASGNAATPV